MIYPLTLSQNGFSSCGLKSPRPPSDWGSRQTHRTQKSYCPQSYHLLHASWQRERHMGKRVCTSVWLSSLADTPGVSDIFALLTLERLPLLELASPKPAFPARALPVPSHWWLLPTFPPRPQSILAYPGASTCGSSWHGLPPPPVFQNTLLGGSHSAMLGWGVTSDRQCEVSLPIREAHPSLGCRYPMIHRATPQQRTIFCPKCQCCWGWGTWTRDYEVFCFCFWRHPKACEISVPQPGIELGPQQWKPQILTAGPPGNSQIVSMSKSLETVPL